MDYGLLIVVTMSALPIMTVDAVDRIFRGLSCEWKHYGCGMVRVDCERRKLPYLIDCCTDFNTMKMDMFFPTETVILVYVRYANCYVVLVGLEYEDSVVAMVTASKIIEVNDCAKPKMRKYMLT
jgi:hypothetical protein